MSTQNITNNDQLYRDIPMYHPVPSKQQVMPVQALVGTGWWYGSTPSLEISIPTTECVCILELFIMRWVLFWRIVLVPGKTLT